MVKTVLDLLARGDAADDHAITRVAGLIEGLKGLDVGFVAAAMCDIDGSLVGT